MEGREMWPPRSDTAVRRGREKSWRPRGLLYLVRSQHPFLPSPPGALMSDLSLFEEPPLEDPNKEVVSSLGAMYGLEAIKGVQCSTTHS